MVTCTNTPFNRASGRSGLYGNIALDLWLEMTTEKSKCVILWNRDCSASPAIPQPGSCASHTILMTRILRLISHAGPCCAVIYAPTSDGSVSRQEVHNHARLDTRGILCMCVSFLLAKSGEQGTGMCVSVSTFSIIKLGHARLDHRANDHLPRTYWDLLTVDVPSIVYPVQSWLWYSYA